MRLTLGPSALAVLLVAGCTTAPASRPADVALEAAVDEAMRETSVPGMAVLEIRDGRPMREIVRGVRRVGTSDRVQPGDRWHLGSNGKPITTTLIAMLIERGKFRWDSRVAELLPDLVPNMHPAYRDATVAELASHRAGLAGDGDLERVMPFYDDARPLVQQRLAFLRDVLRDEPSQPRGTYAYSNRGFILLGAIADRHGGAPVEALIRDMIFKPLGMRTAGFGPTGKGEPWGHEGGKALSGPKQDNPAFWTTAGTIHMSMKDWARWSIDQMQGERGKGRLLRPESYRYLHAAQIHPPGRKSSVALDWGLRTDTYGRILTHSGSNGAWYAVIALAPDIDGGILIAANAAEDMKGDQAMAPITRAATSRWKEGAAQPSQEQPGGGQ